MQNIKEIVEKFFIATHLPILAVDSDGEIIVSFGFDKNFHSLFEDHNIFEGLKKQLVEKKLVSIPIPNMKNTFFTGCYINPQNINMGFFVLGPHSCINNTSTGIPYKPRCLMPSLVSLLYSLLKEFSCYKIKSSYSYHVRKALDYIISRYNENLTLLDVANYLNINKSYLCSLFKKELGKTFTSILNEIRIEKSKKLLLDSDDSILDIALQVGFNNQNYYNIVFKKITNMTPMEFKNKAEV